MIAAMFALGYVLQRFVIGRASHGRDENILLVTLGLAIVIENLALCPSFESDTRTIETATRSPPSPILGALIALPKLVAFARRPRDGRGAARADHQDRPRQGDPRRARRSARGRGSSASTSSTCSR